MPNTEFIIEDLSDFFEFGEKKKLNFKMTQKEAIQIERLENVTIKDLGSYVFLNECYSLPLKLDNSDSV